jgi:hypothetical protein
MKPGPLPEKSSGQNWELQQFLGCVLNCHSTPQLPISEYISEREKKSGWGVVVLTFNSKFMTQYF